MTLRERIVQFYERHDDDTQAKLAAEFGVSQSFVEKLLHRWRASGSSATLPRGDGRQPTLKDHDGRLHTLLTT